MKDSQEDKKDSLSPKDVRGVERGRSSSFHGTSCHNRALGSDSRGEEEEEVEEEG